MRFTWDLKKAAANLKKHGISFTEAVTAFNDRGALYEPDKDGIEKGNLIAYSVESRMLFVVYLEREDSGLVRLISARKTTKPERKRYEENLKSLL
jgi:uncharacterized DUF497 family protein